MTVSKTKYIKDPDVVSRIEKEILWFLLEDVKFIEDIFFVQKVPVELFWDKEVKMIADIILDNYRNHKSLLVRNEFILHIDYLLSAKKIVITGSESFIGKTLISQLQSTDYEIIGFDSLEPTNPTYEFHQIDIRNPEINKLIPVDTD